MSDQTGGPVPPRDASPEGPSNNRRIPPLVWIILAIVIAWIGYAFLQARGHHPYKAPAPATAPQSPAAPRT